MGESYYLEEKGRYSTVDKCKEIIISISASPLVLYSLLAIDHLLQPSIPELLSW
jgi:hypothetical protein